MQRGGMGKLFAVDSQKRRNGGIYHVNDLPMNYSFTSHNKIKIPFPPSPHSPKLRLLALFNVFVMCCRWLCPPPARVWHCTWHA